MEAVTKERQGQKTIAAINHEAEMKKLLLFCPLLANQAWAKPDDAIKKLLRTHVQATNQENLSDLLATLDSTCSDYPKQAAMMPNIFDQFDLKYSLENFKVLSATENEAEVAITLCTEKIEGPTFRNNRVKQLLKINKTENGWQMCSGKMMTIQYLDVEPQHQEYFGNGPEKCLPSI